MRTIVAHVVTHDTGKVNTITLTDSADYTSKSYDYKHLCHLTAPIMGIFTRPSVVPHLGDYDSGEKWREALADYVTRLARYNKTRGAHDLPYALGNRLAYVDAACCTYTFEIDLEMPEVPLT